MTVKEITKDWKSLCGYVVGKVSGEIDEKLSIEQIDEINKIAVKIAKDAGIDEVLPFAKKVMNLDILDKKVNFKIFEEYPAVWHKLYATSIDVVAVEVGQSVMSR
jgi:hypothetical protein